MGRRKNQDKALERLAELFEFGSLQASTDVAAFLERVCDEIEYLRARAGETKMDELSRRGEERP